MTLDENQVCNICEEACPAFYVTDTKELVKLAEKRRAEIYAAGDALMGIALRTWLLEEVLKDT